MAYSVQETRKILPNDFIEELAEIFTTNYQDKILQGMTNRRSVTLRINTAKSDFKEISDELWNHNIKFDRAAFYSNALILKDKSEKDLYDLDIYKTGKIYLQSLSSMIPALVLNPKETDKVLDMCAAPGSKTTLLSNIMNNKGTIIANEIDKIRFERLKYNCELQGATDVETINGRGELLYKDYENSFDKVLLDVPCSGEGRFISNSPQTYRDWSLRTVKELSKLQKRLIKSACVCLKNEGEMVYSTCTLNFEENEKIIDFAIKELGMKVETIVFERKQNFIDGYTNNFNRMIYNDANLNFDSDVSKSIKILPDKDYEGFFVCKLKRLQNNLISL